MFNIFKKKEAAHQALDRKIKGKKGKINLNRDIAKYMRHHQFDTLDTRRLPSQ